MKTIKLLMAVVSMLVAGVSCAQKKDAPKVKALVVYYSQTSNTKTVAEEIASLLRADIKEIQAVKPYDGDFQATISRSMKDRQDGVKPEIKPLNVDFSKYDVIFLGYPIWFGTYAPPVDTFLDQVDLSGKKIVPFCTFGSGGLDTSVKDLASRQPNATILPGYGVRAARLKAVSQEVDQFLRAGGFIEGEYTKLAPFPEQHAVSAEESAIFDKAVGDYPMIHAKAETVAQRAIPGGLEYLFTAKDTPRDGGQAMPPAGSMKVYVIVVNGQAPEFTQVVR
jgi:flavodoxin